MKTIFLFLALACMQWASAQSNDYLVLKSGDTLRGELRYENHHFLVDNEKDPVRAVDAGDVYKVNGRKVKKGIIVSCLLHFYTDNIQELEVHRYRTLDRDTVIALDEIYSTPKMNLYWGVDEFGSQYYFYKTPTDSVPVQLFVKYYLAGDLGNSLTLAVSQANGATHVEVQKGYVNQLRLIMGDCKKISEGEWEMLDYRSYSLKSLIKKFNRCN